jgi:hypothetical protein
MKVVPAPGWLDTSMLPPSASTMALPIASPRPLRPSAWQRDLVDVLTFFPGSFLLAEHGRVCYRLNC